MKLSKSKLALAKVINENGGWVDDSANWAVQPKREEGDIWFSSSDNKPYRNEGMDGFTFDGSGLWLDDIIKHDKLHKNWHQCVLSREEYYQAYPEADDGWIEWKGGMKSPVESGVPVDVKTKDGNEHYDQLLGDACWHDNWGDANIIAYRTHKTDVNPEFCESVMRSIPEPEEKPTIEQLAQDYRNAKDHADSLQKDAGEAAVKAESFAVEIRKKILELQELIG